MAEPLSREDVLANLDYLAKQPYDQYCDGCVEAYELATAIAAAVRGWCVVEGGHKPYVHGDQRCRHCGQRREDVIGAEPD